MRNNWRGLLDTESDVVGAVFPSTTSSAYLELADQLRQQSPGVDWNIQGIDRAQELAKWLNSKGVKTLGSPKITWEDYKYPDTPAGYYSTLSGDSEITNWLDATPGPTVKRGYLDFDGVRIGNEGNIHSGNGWIGYIPDNGAKNDNQAFASSTKGHGAVSYQYVTSPDGGLRIIPKWTSTSDMGAVRDVLKTGAVLAGGLGLAGIGPLSGLGEMIGTAASSAGPISAAEQIGFLAANGMTDAAIAASMPELAAAGGLTGVGGASAAGGLLAASEASPVFNAAADSQLASSQLGITGAQSAAAATAPAAVDLGSLGGITSTAAPMPIDALRASELAGYSSAPAATTAPAVTAPAASGGLLGNATGLLGDAATWMKDNPILAKLLMGGATSLLSATGSNSNTAPAKNYGPPVQWKSNLQQGLLTPTPQQMPQAIQNKPAGLLAQGFQNDGAWRYLRG